MTKIKKLSFALILITFLGCTDTSDFWDAWDNANASGISEECTASQQAVATASIAFSNANADTYAAMCSLYAAALESAIATCSDPNGSYQAELNALGDCEGSIDPPTCEETQAATEDAQINYDNAASTDENYTELCVAYQNALANQIDICGDADGSLQDILDELDCTSNQTCESASAATSDAEITYNQASPTDSNYTELCVAYQNALTNQIDICGDADGSLQDILDGLDCTTSGPIICDGNGSITFTAGADFSFDSNIVVTIEDGFISVYAEESGFDGFTVYLEMPVNETGDIIDVFTFTTATTVNDIWADASTPFTPFESNITINNGVNSLQGEFFGSLINSSGGVIELYNGVINISYSY